MIDQARTCTGLNFREGMLEQVHPNPGDVLHNSCTGVYLHLGPTPRAVPLIDKQRWLDRGVPVGPGGTSDGRFHPSEVFQLWDQSPGGCRSASAR